MTHKHDIIVCKISEPYPVPTEAEMTATPDRWLSFNEWSWRISQGVIGSLANEAIWEEYSEELDQALHGLMIPHMPTALFDGARVYRTGSVAAPAGANTISWQAVDHDTTSYWDSGNPSQLTVPRDGYYAVNGAITLTTVSTTTSGLREVQVTKSGTVIARNRNSSTVPNTGISLFVSTTKYFTAGQYAELKFTNSTGVTLNVVETDSYTWLEMLFLGE